MFSKTGKCKQCVVEGDDKEKMIFSKSNPLCAPHYKKQQSEKKPYKRLSSSSKGKTSPTTRSSLHGAKKSIILDFTREDYDNMKLSTLVKFADFYFRRYLLGKTPRNADRQIYCPLTEKWLDEDKIHVCHLSPRQYLATRWSEDNCILCAESSNVWEDKILVDGGTTLHIQKLRGVLQKGDIEKASSLTPPDKQDIINLIKKFKMNNFKQCCESCGSEDVARLQWVNVNTEEVYGGDPGVYTEWCFGKCKDQTIIIDSEDFQDEEE